jgi:hypothetical protein
MADIKASNIGMHERMDGKKKISSELLIVLKEASEIWVKHDTSRRSRKGHLSSSISLSKKCLIDSQRNLLTISL